MPATWTVDSDVYNFVEWEDMSTDPTRIISLTNDTIITAYYELVPTHTLTIEVYGVGGTTNPAPGTYPYAEGTAVTVTAIPDTRYNFDHWTLDGVDVGDTNPYYLIVDADHTLIAHFNPPSLSLKLTGQLDYLSMENIRVRLAALVKDATTLEPISNADVSIAIYDADGALWVSDTMVERLAGTGIYEWESEKTIRLLRLEKGVYLAHVTASLQGGQTASDILEFHIDPPQDQPIELKTLLTVTVIGVVAIITSVWYISRRKLERKPCEPLRTRH